MAFSLQFLGTGGSFSRYDINYHNNALITDDKGNRVLIDCGQTAPQALHEMKVAPWDIKGVAITHLHSDHIGGLEQLIWERYYTGPNGPGFKSTQVMCHHDMPKLIERYLEGSLNPFTSKEGVMSARWDKELVKLVAGSDAWIGDFYIKFWKADHVKGLDNAGHEHDKAAYGLEVRDGAKAQCFFSGDTTFDPQVASKHKGASVIFHECMFFPKYPGTVHTHYEELKTLPDDVKAKMVLMHYTQVPDGIDVVADGFRAAAKRFESFLVS